MRRSNSAATPPVPTPRLSRGPAVVALHVLAWAALLTLLAVSRFDHAVKFGDRLTDPEDLDELLSWALFVGYFYLHRHVLAPRLFYGGRRGAYALAVAAALATVILLPKAIVGVALPPPPRQVGLAEAPPPPREVPLWTPARGGRDFAAEYGGFILLYGVATLGTLVVLAQARLRAGEALARRAQLAQLSAQARPHFLFNTLNGLYGLALAEEAPRTAEGLLHAADFLRYAAEAAGAEAVALGREVAQLRDYLALQRMRLGDTADLRLAVDDARAAPGARVAPLLLLTFVENACKHGVSPEAASWVHVDLHAAGRELRLRVDNSRHPTRGRADGGAGLGLANVRERLGLLYPGRHALDVDASDPARFRVDLRLTLDTGPA